VLKNVTIHLQTKHALRKELKMSHEEIENMVLDIDDYGVDLTEWEINFIADLIDNPPVTFSEEQINTIEKIYLQRV